MNKTKWFKPYIKPGKCTLTKTGPGVYLIAKGQKVIYIGYSASDLKKTMYRHFQEWNDPTQRRVVYKNLADIKCRVVFTTAKRAAMLEESLIIKYSPKDNEQKLKLYTDKDRVKIEVEYWEAPEVPF